MSLPLIRAALEKKLALLSPALVTSYENVPFNSVSGIPYQRVNLMLATPDNSMIGGFMYREMGIFQVSLCYPLSTGPANAEAKAQALRLHFRRGTSLIEGTLTINIISTPRVSPAMVDIDRYVIPVSIPWQCDITT